MLTVAAVLAVLIFTGVVVGLLASDTLDPPPASPLGPALPWAAFAAALLWATVPTIRTRITESGGRPPDEAALVGRWLNGQIIALGLREAPALVGIGLALAAGSTLWALLFGLTGVGVLAGAWPRADELREEIRRLRAGE